MAYCRYISCRLGGFLSIHCVLCPRDTYVQSDCNAGFGQYLDIPESHAHRISPMVADIQRCYGNEPLYAQFRGFYCAGIHSICFAF